MAASKVSKKKIGKFQKQDKPLFLQHILKNFSFGFFINSIYFWYNLIMNLGTVFQIKLGLCLFALLFSAYSPIALGAPGKTSLISNEKVRYLTHYEAAESCPAGTRLPTIRELAEEAEKRGAKGILELNQVDPKAVQKGYRKVSVINMNGKKDEFYFNHHGYKKPKRELDKNNFWSSSINSEFSDGVYVFNGEYGTIGSVCRGRKYHDTFLCIPKK